MRRLLSLLVVAAACGTALWTSSARADDHTLFQLVPMAQVGDDGVAVNVTPVRVGYGWRGYGYYGGPYRPYYSYGRPYYGGGYYGSYYRPYYQPYYGGYYGGGYRAPYVTGYRGWGGWY